MAKTVPSFADLPDATLRELLDLVEGRGILSESALTDRGVPQALADTLVTTFKSDYSDHKSTLFDSKGNRVPSLRGVYDLSLARRICLDLGADADEPYFGRGRNARHLVASATKAIEERAAARGGGEGVRAVALSDADVADVNLAQGQYSRMLRAKQEGPKDG